MIARTGDHGLVRAGRRAARKLSEATALSETLFSSSWGPEASATIDLTDIRTAIRQTQVIQISYLDDCGAKTNRAVLPLAVIYYADSIVLAAWCSLRLGFCHFRPDRISSHKIGPEIFADRAAALC